MTLEHLGNGKKSSVLSAQLARRTVRTELGG